MLFNVCIDIVKEKTKNIILFIDSLKVKKKNYFS